MQRSVYHIVCYEKLSEISVGNWKNRHAAIMGISTVGEGCKRQMEPVIEEIVNNVLPFLGDSVSKILGSFRIFPINYGSLSITFDHPISASTCTIRCL